ncbi:helical backbone metal receptor [Bacillus sp. FJAT-45350]|uniref:helical backbone metal receptor n=1 Tax=Bacillus sp. FJAT-45350 TaxID=2011014 RepID=UPI00359C8C4A
MKKCLTILMALLVTLILLVGCNTTDTTVEAPDEDQAIETEQEDVVEGEGDEDQFPLTLTDAMDNEVTIEEEPKRIVSLIPSITETIFALDKGEYLVGRTDWCNYPEAALEVDSVGGMEFDVEKLLSLTPDLVISHASGAHSSADGLDQLRNAGVTVVVVNDATSIDDVYKAIAMIANVTGAVDKGEEIVSEMTATFEEIAAKASAISVNDQVKVWVEVSPAPEIYTTGKGTFLDEMLQMINATNAASEVDGWAMFTEEEAVAFNPDVIVTTYGYYVENPSEQIKQRSAWKDVTAVTNDRIYDVDPDQVTRSGPRLVKGVEELATRIYPDVFAE